MKNDRLEDRPELSTSQSARRARLQALLFAGAAVGTTLLTLVSVGPKLPPYQSE